MTLPFFAFLRFLVFYPKRALLLQPESKRILTTSQVGVGGAGDQMLSPTPTRAKHRDSRTLELPRWTAESGRLTCPALVVGRAAGAPSRTSSTSASSRHRVPSTAPSQPACAWIPAAALGTEAPRPMTPTDSLSGLGERGLRDLPQPEDPLGEAPRWLRLQPPGWGREAGAATPEGNQLAILKSARGPRACGWVAVAWAGPAGRAGLLRRGGGAEGTRRATTARERTDTKGSVLGKDGQLGSPNWPGLNDPTAFSPNGIQPFDTE